MRIIFSPIDAFILMLCLGGLAHRLNLPWLAIDYESSFLIMLASIAILPSDEYYLAKVKRAILNKEENK